MNHALPSGLNCFPGGIDCGFSGQVTACCDSIDGLTKVRFTSLIILELCHNKYAIQIGHGCTQI
ncbi:hypothetical protein B0H13DRAFT_1656937 [Mycena leptocephala]|nr:hypothetical protein B0H13DRAFT_1656937 [Mycena leptocephala]